MKSNFMTEILNKLKQIFNIQCSLIILMIIEIIFALIVFNNGILNLSPIEKLILILLLLACLRNSEIKLYFVKEFFNTRTKKFFLSLLYLYTAFALVGYKCFFANFYTILSVKGICIYAIAVLLVVPVINSVLYWIYLSRYKVCNIENTCSTKKFFIISLAILLLPSIATLFAFNPGCSSIDTYSTMIVNAKNIYGMYDWHPFFYCLILRKIEKIWDSTYAVVIWQLLMYVYVILEFLLFLRKHKINERFLFAICFIIGFSPANYLQINTIWKDIPYTLSLLWTFVIVLKLTVDSDFYKKRILIYIELIFALLGVYLFRKNGVATFWIIFLCILPIAIRNIKVLFSFIICLLLVYFIQVPLANHYKVVSSGTNGIYIGLGQDLLGVYYRKGNLSEDALSVAQKLTDNKLDTYEYKPSWSYIQYKTDITPAEFVKSYILTFIHNPVIMTKAILARHDCLWDIPGDGTIVSCTNYTDTLDQYSYDDESIIKMQKLWLSYYQQHYPVLGEKIISEITNLFIYSHVLNMISWRTGVFTLLGVIVSFMLGFIDGIKLKLFYLISPVAAHSISLFLSTGWSDFRYYWPVNLLIILFYATYYLLLSSKLSKSMFKRKTILEPNKSTISY